MTTGNTTRLARDIWKLRIFWHLRAWACEMLVWLALRVAPEGWTSSPVQAAIDFYRRGVEEGKRT